MRKELLDKQDEYYKKSINLRNLAMWTSGAKGDKMRKEQDEAYKRYNFYKNIIKANDKIK